MLTADDIVAALTAAGGADGAIAALLDSMTDHEVAAVLAASQAVENERRFRRFETMFPDDGPFRRDLYPRHLEFFEAGRDYTERTFMAGNRVGKTQAAAFESAGHLTGAYPEWWPGRVFPRPVKQWAAGDTNETTRDIIQLALLGEVTWSKQTFRKVVDGSGMIPRDLIGEVSWKQGVPNLVDTVRIKHKSGGWSKLGLKSYDQGRRVFQGTEQDIVWLDEEPPEDVYGECLIRLATTRGMMMLTFTPLRGLSKVVLSFLPKEMHPDA